MIDLYQYLFKNYITYDALFALNKKAFYQRSDAESVDIYIDMYSLVKDLFTTPFEFVMSDNSVLTSSVINLCAHLRSYYYRYHRVWARFYIVWAWNRPDNVRAIMPEYNAHVIMAQDAKTITRKLVEENITLLETICPYLPDIFFFNGGNYETTTVITSLFQLVAENINKTNIPNIIYSRDSYPYLAVSDNSLTFLFRPKKSRGVDQSYMVSKTNLIDSYVELELKQVHYNQLSDYKMFLNYIAYGGFKARGVNSVLRFKVAIDHLSNGKELFFSNEEINRVNLMFRAFNPVEQSAIYRNSVEYSLLSKGYINLHNPEEVKRVNDLYFTQYPLDLNAL